MQPDFFLSVGIRRDLKMIRELLVLRSSYLVKIAWRESCLMNSQFKYTEQIIFGTCENNDVDISDSIRNLCNLHI